MFILNMCYTSRDIINFKNQDDIVFIDGISFTDKELLEDWDSIPLRFYRRESKHLMFTLRR